MTEDETFWPCYLHLSRTCVVKYDALYSWIENYSDVPDVPSVNHCTGVRR